MATAADGICIGDARSTSCTSLTAVTDSTQPLRRSTRARKAPESIYESIWAKQSKMAEQYLDDVDVESLGDEEDDDDEYLKGARAANAISDEDEDEEEEEEEEDESEEETDGSAEYVPENEDDDDESEMDDDEVYVEENSEGEVEDGSESESESEYDSSEEESESEEEVDYATPPASKRRRVVQSPKPAQNDLDVVEAAALLDAAPSTGSSCICAPAMQLEECAPKMQETPTLPPIPPPVTPLSNLTISSTSVLPPPPPPSSPVDMEIDG